MFTLFLMIMSFAGGAAILFFTMDRSRRKYLELITALQNNEIQLNSRIRQHAEAEAYLDRREKKNEQKQQSLELMAKEHQGRSQNFDSRVIKYEHLAAENSILKTDLKNLRTFIDRLEYINQAAQSSQSNCDSQRDRIGQVYFQDSTRQIERDLTGSNYITAKKRLQMVIDFLAEQGVIIAKPEVQTAFTALRERYEKILRAEAERAHQQELKEQIREQQKLERESQAARVAAELAAQQQQQIQLALDRARAEATASVTGQFTGEIERLQIQLAQAKAEAEAKKDRAISLAQLTKSGFVYVISNVGSFGHGVYKIGLTRREDPMERVIELGDASVPFRFDVHMLISCNDAPKLEKELHREFHRHRINKINLRKEFFRVSIHEIVAAVRKHHGEVEYQADAEALEYMQSQTMTEADYAEIEQAFEQSEEE